jgi:hypothetical protein
MEWAKAPLVSPAFSIRMCTPYQSGAETFPASVTLVLTLSASFCHYCCSFKDDGMIFDRKAARFCCRKISHVNLLPSASAAPVLTLLALLLPLLLHFSIGFQISHPKFHAICFLCLQRRHIIR